MSCRGILRVITCIGKWIPVVFVAAICGYSFYSYNIIFLMGYKDDVMTRVALGFFFNLIFVLFVSSYIMTVFTPIRKVPQNYFLPPDYRSVIENSIDGADAAEVLRKFAHENNLPVRTCDVRTGSVRYCYKCGSVKPDRCSHCSVCDKCVMKYDHHCIWVNNCVNFFNYKFFILFLFYGFLLCIYGSLSLLPNFIDLLNHRNVRKGEIYLIVLFFFAGMFGISMVSLLGFHIYLVSKNQSTVEFARPPVLDCGPFKGAYDLGICQNLKQVFGRNPLKWFLPVPSSIGTGCEYPLSPRYYSIVYSEDAEAVGGGRSAFNQPGQSANITNGTSSAASDRYQSS